jgi:hypothetical protein
VKRRPPHSVLVFALATVALVTSACGQRAEAGPLAGGTTTHLAVIVFENKESSAIVGASAAPYINGTLIPSGRLFTRYYAVAHPSLTNYLVMTSARFNGCVTDGCPRNSNPDENLFHQMNAASPQVTWKAYQEGMPFNCYRWDSGTYLVRHNPATYYTNIGPSADNSCASKDVPYTQLAGDIANNRLPQFVWITPNKYNDMHDDQNTAPCSLGSAVQNEVCQGDRWLSNNLPTLLSNGGRNDVTALIVFDEGFTKAGGGGQVVLLEVGPSTCTGCTSSLPLTHYGLLWAIEDWFQLPRLSPTVPGLP